MDNFESNRKELLQVCCRELMLRRVKNVELRDMIRGVDNSKGKGYNSNYGRD